MSETPTLRLAAEHSGAWAGDWVVSNEWTIITENLRERGKLQRDENIVRSVSINAGCSGCQEMNVSSNNPASD